MFAPGSDAWNPICVRETEIGIKSGDVIINIIIDYDEVVNMKDPTGLSGEIKFADQFETVPIENPGPIKSKHRRPNLSKSSKRTASLLEKFADTDYILDSEKWDTSANTENNIRNEEL